MKTCYSYDSRLFQSSLHNTSHHTWNYNLCFKFLRVLVESSSAFSSSHGSQNIQSARQSAFHSAGTAPGRRLMESHLMSSYSTRHNQAASSSPCCFFHFFFLFFFWMWTRVAQSLKFDSVHPLRGSRCDSKKTENNHTPYGTLVSSQVDVCSVTCT